MGNVPGFEDDGLTDEQREQKAMDEALYPPERMWVMSDDGMRMRDNFEGARNFWSIFWAIIQPAASLGFLIVGLSTKFGNLVDFTPLTSQYLYFLRPTQDMFWFPQGVAMSFYGFFGFFVFGPLQWWLTVYNKGQGFCEFNKKTKRMVLVKDEELVKDLSFDDIDKVVFEWTDLAIGDREVSVFDTDGNKIKIMDTTEDDWPKRILERRASQLADFLGKELEIQDSY